MLEGLLRVGNWLTFLPVVKRTVTLELLNTDLSFHSSWVFDPPPPPTSPGTGYLFPPTPSTMPPLDSSRRTRVLRFFEILQRAAGVSVSALRESVDHPRRASTLLSKGLRGNISMLPPASFTRKRASLHSLDQGDNRRATQRFSVKSTKPSRHEEKIIRRHTALRSFHRQVLHESFGGSQPYPQPSPSPHPSCTALLTRHEPAGFVIPDPQPRPLSFAPPGSPNPMATKHKSEFVCGLWIGLRRGGEAPNTHAPGCRHRYACRY